MKIEIHVHHHYPDVDRQFRIINKKLNKLMSASEEIKSDLTSLRDSLQNISNDVSGLLAKVEELTGVIENSTINAEDAAEIKALITEIKGFAENIDARTPPATETPETPTPVEPETGGDVNL